jgi:hypothetical protein
MYETDDLARLREMAGIAEELKPSDVPAYVRKARGEAPKSLADLEAERNQGPTTAAGLRQKAIDLGIEDPDQPTEEGVAGGALGAVIGGGLTKSVGGAVTGAKIGSAAQNMIKHQAVKENLLKELSQYKS